jgi:hypothetical protein
MTTILLNHLDQVSLFGRSSLALFLILFIDWGFSAAHTYEEWRGEEVPLWRVFGAVVGLWFPQWLGFFLFTLVLTLLLWLVGLAGIAGWLPFAGQLSLPTTVGALRSSHWSADFRHFGFALGTICSGLSSKSRFENHTDLCD